MYQHSDKMVNLGTLIILLLSYLSKISKIERFFRNLSKEHTITGSLHVETIRSLFPSKNHCHLKGLARFTTLFVEEEEMIHEFGFLFIKAHEKKVKEGEDWERTTTRRNPFSAFPFSTQQRCPGESIISSLQLENMTQFLASQPKKGRFFVTTSPTIFQAGCNIL